MAPPATLPPLNPMSTAPRDGTRIVVMGTNGQIAPVEFGGSMWVGWIAGSGISGMPVRYPDSACLGWWPMPEVRGE